MNLIARHIEPVLAAALTDTRVVSLVGPRQAGKSTIAKRLVQQTPGAIYLTLDEDATRRAAASDPEGLVLGHQALVA